MNPDASDGARTTLEQRVAVVAGDVNRFLTQSLAGVESRVPHVGFYFYHSKARKHVDAATAARDSLVVYRADCGTSGRSGGSSSSASGSSSGSGEPVKKRRRLDAAE